MYYPLKRGVVRVFILLVISLLAAQAFLGSHRDRADGNEPSGLEENGRRSRRCRRPIGAAVAARVSDERSEESARQDERQPVSRSPRSAARLVTTGLNGLEETGREARHHRTAAKTMCLRNTLFRT